MKRTKISVVCVTIILSLMTIFAPDLRSQGLFGTISGTVTDSSGAVIPGAKVTVRNISTNVTITLSTNNVGAYSATSLNPGVYDVQADATGFKTATVKGVTLEVSANPKIDLALSVGRASQEVNVVATPSLLQAQQSNLGQTVNQQQLDQLPTQSGTGRSVYSLLFLAAGVSEQKGGGGGDNENLRINGDRPRSDDYVLDGTTIEQPVFGGQSFNPSVDSIQEFRVETNSMSAEYGKSSGGVIIAVTKSGTNHLHGSLYEYLRNEKLDARNFFDKNPTKNPLKYNEFGGTIGGRIIRDKLFFFTDYQGIRQRGSSPSVGNVVPNSAFRNGDLSALCTAGFDGAGNCLDASQQVYLPGTSMPVPFNNITQINTISQKLLALFPTSSVAGSAPGTSLASFNSPNSTSINRFNPRIDYNLSAADHIFGAFHRQTGRGTVFDLVVGPAGEQDSRSDDYATTVGWTHAFSGNMLNDFRFGYMHRIGDRGGYGQGFTSPSDFGVSGIPDCLSSIPGTDNGAKCGTPGVTVNGFNGLSTGSTLYEPASVLQFGDTVTRVIGRHSMKWGTELRHYAIDNYQPNNVTGDFKFNGGQTGYGFADFLFGAVSQGSSVQVQNAFVSSRAWSLAFFVQDDYKLRPRLTLNLGLRYQLDNSFHEIHKGNAFFNPFTAQWEQFGVNAPEATFDRSLKEFGPRVGFAYNPVSGLVVRGGYGIMFPGTVGHGRAGDGQPGPNLLASTTFAAGTQWSALPPIVSPDPSAITAPIPTNGNVSFQSWAPRKQSPTYIQLWNFTVEKQLNATTAVQAAYVGSHGVHLPVNYAYNICQQTPQSAATFGYNASTSPYCPDAAAAVLAGGGSLYDLVITPGWWGLSSSVYHSLQAKFDHRFSHDFSLLANFTWSKLIDDSSSDWGGFWSLDVLGQDFYNRRSERSVSAGDVPLRLTLAPIYEMPFGPGKKYAQSGPASQIIGGWRLTAVYTVSNGYPFGITDNSYGYCNAAHLLTDRPNMIGNPLPAGFSQTLEHWFDVSAFDFSGTCPAAGLVNLTGPGDPAKAFGNAPRYFSKTRVPGINNLNFSLQKDFKIPVGEQTRLTFRADLYNAFNHPQFASPNSDPTVGNFGSITSTAIPNRTIQLGLHLYF